MASDQQNAEKFTRSCYLQEQGTRRASRDGEPVHYPVRLRSKAWCQDGDLLFQGDRGVLCLRKAAEKRQAHPCGAVRRQHRQGFRPCLLRQRHSDRYLHPERQHQRPLVPEKAQTLREGHRNPEWHRLLRCHRPWREALQGFPLSGRRRCEEHCQKGRNGNYPAKCRRDHRTYS